MQFESARWPRFWKVRCAVRFTHYESKLGKRRPFNLKQLKMKIYYIVSIMLVLITYNVLIFCKIILGGSKVVPIGFSIFIIAVILNIIVAIICFIFDVMKNKF